MSLLLSIPKKIPDIWKIAEPENFHFPISYCSERAEFLYIISFLPFIRHALISIVKHLFDSRAISFWVPLPALACMKPLAFEQIIHKLALIFPDTSRMTLTVSTAYDL